MMTEIIGDVVEPSILRLPTGTAATMSGAGLIFISGAKVWFSTGAGSGQVEQL